MIGSLRWRFQIVFAWHDDAGKFITPRYFDLLAATCAWAPCVNLLNDCERDAHAAVLHAQRGETYAIYVMPNFKARSFGDVI